jgi:hypothetical protein
LRLFKRLRTTYAEGLLSRRTCERQAAQSLCHGLQAAQIRSR